MITNNHHSDDLLTIVIGWVSASVGNIFLFGMEMFKAFVLGIMGALGAILVKWFYNKFIRKHGK